MERIKSLVKTEMFWVIVLLVTIATVAFFTYFPNHWNLSYGDAQSRLNISRKIVDNLTPGLAQLGNIWLPLPQLLMLPFIWNMTMWQTGFAGAVMSLICYVVGGVYLYKTLRVFGLTAFWSIVSLGVYALNINIVYFATTAMSELVFISSTCAAAYYFSLWLKNHDRFLLLKAALAVGAMTLTRYEGLAVLLSSYVVVFIMAWVINKKRSRAEGDTIIYATLASLGFGLWTIYLAVIFGDPLYWKNYYGATTVIDGRETYLSNISFIAAAIKYAISTIWMNGLLPVLLSIFGLIFLLIKLIKNKSYYFIPTLMMLSMYGFMILTLMKNTPITQPELSISSIIDSKTSLFGEFNIRYGLLMAPIVTLLVGVLFLIKYKFVRIFILFILAFQFVSYFTNFTLIFKTPKLVYSTPRKDDGIVSWMKANYDGGLIMISALGGHDPQMLQMAFPYKTYIHEGTGKYWKESIVHPSSYARWIIMDYMNRIDEVAKYLKDSEELEHNYEVVHQAGNTRIYKRKM